MVNNVFSLTFLDKSFNLDQSEREVEASTNAFALYLMVIIVTRGYL